MNAPKRKGTAFESAVRDTLAPLLGRKVHRIAQTGGRDTGDLRVEGVDIVVEAKAGQSYELGTWMAETITEQANAGTRWSALVVKRRQKPIAKSFVVMELDQWADLLDAAMWRPETTAEPRPINESTVAALRLVHDADRDRARADHPTARPTDGGAA